MENPFNFFYEEDKLEIELLGEIDFRAWAVWYGVIQNEITNVKKENIYVNLTKCKDCIPIALISLILSLARRKSMGTRIVVNLYKQFDEYGERIYMLFSNMGIFETCKKLGIEVIIDGSTEFEAEEYLEELQIGDDILIPLTIVDTKKIYDLYAYVMELVEIKARKLCVEDTIKVKIENILFETIDNIKKHAYLDEKEALAGIFVCRKEGFLGKEERVDQRRVILKRLRKEYGNNYDGIKLDYLQQKQAYFEIIVMDEGVGITSTLEVRNTNGLYTKYPFFQSFKRTLVEGERKKYAKQEEKSYYSGLNLVFNLLAESSDYVYGKEKEEYVFAQCGGVKPAIDSRLYQNEINEFKGLAWIFHVGCNFSNVDDNYSYRSDISKNESLLRVCRENDMIAPNEFNNICIWDERRVSDSIENFFYDCKGKQLSESTEEHIWLIEGHRGKNTVLNEIEKKMSLFNKENSVLIIADIPDSDMMIFFMALQNTKVGSTKCNKIIAVSKTLRVSIFQRGENDVFYYKRDIAIEFCKSGKGEKLEESLVQVYRFLRKYDSSIWWSKVLQSQKREYLIKHGCIMWEQFQLKYYINLEMMLENHDLYGLVQCNLERVRGFVSKFGEFRNTDIIMKKACIEANHGTRNRDSDYSRIYVESVYVSGKTDQILDLRENDIKLCLFQNNFYMQEESNIREVAHIFVWPKEEILDKYVGIDKDNWERKRNTHTVQIVSTKEVSDDIIDKKNENVYKKKYYEVLHDMSHMYAGFIRLGHFSYHSNHDIISFNIIAIIKMSFYKKSGPFVYILRRFVNCFGIKAYNGLKSDWKKSVGEMDNLLQDSSIMVYRSHYYTDYIIKLLYECFDTYDDEMWNLVIPLDSIEEKNYMNPLTISDIQYQYIGDVLGKYNTDKKCKILLFDTMISSGQTSREIQNIFNSIAKKSEIELEFEYAYLFDCEDLQYRRNTDIKFEAYYRANIPRIGRKKSCLFCKIRENVSKYCNIFISKLAEKRILKWTEIWQPISPLFADGKGGFINSRVDNIKVLWEEIGINVEVEYCDFFTLATQLIEIAYSNRDKEFLLKICDKESLLTIEQKMQLLEIQLLLFSTDDNYKLYYNVIHKIVRYMNFSETVSNVTALASMLIIDGDKDALHNIFLEMDSKNEELNNEDILIAFAILCYNDTSTSTI